MISRAAQKKIEEQVADALSKGATDETPSNPTFNSTSTPAGGNYVAPRLLLNVDHTMNVMRDETFGPIVPIMKVSSDDEAVSLMNDSHYGLSASVWTKDVQRGEQLTRKLDAGTVFVNRSDYPSPVSWPPRRSATLLHIIAWIRPNLLFFSHQDLAWVGWKDSGLGCSLGPEAFNAFYRLKSYHFKERQA